MINKCAKLTMLLGLMALSTAGWSLEQLDDASMAAQTGQDGVKIALNFPSSTVSFDQAIITDKDGFAGATSAASLVIAPTTFNAGQGISLFNTSDASVLTNNLALAPVLIQVDADANGTAPVLNTKISLPADLKRLRIQPFSVYVASGANSIFTARKINASTSNSYRAGVTEVLRVNQQGIDVVFKDGNPVVVNVQLGNAPQGHMFKLTGGSISCIANNAACLANVDAATLNASNPIEVMSKNTGGNSSLKLNFKLTATDPSTGLRLEGVYGDIVNTGLQIGKDGATDKFDVVLSSLVAGTSNATNATVFNGVRNGSLGNIGLVGASITGLKVNVKGM